jgi:hypothetical protein
MTTMLTKMDSFKTNVNTPSSLRCKNIHSDLFPTYCIYVPTHVQSGCTNSSVQNRAESGLLQKIREDDGGHRKLCVRG